MKVWRWRIGNRIEIKGERCKGKPGKSAGNGSFIMFIISALLLLFLALLLYRLELSEAVVKVAVIVIYIITGLTGGILMGKKIRDKKFLWGFVAGTVYFGILFAVSLIIKGGAGIEPVKMITTWVLCACAGTAGGMIS